MDFLSQQDKDKLDTVTEKLAFLDRYDALADKHDGAMLSQLDRNLDVLLIFVSTPLTQCIAALMSENRLLA